jgi:aminocarboxymuconate-semialdehyde decarboxylase
VDVTDVHAHAAPVRWLTEARFPHVTVSGSAVTFGDGTPGRPMPAGSGSPGLSSPGLGSPGLGSPGLGDGPADWAARAAWLTVQGVDRQVVSVWSDLYGYPLPPDEGADWAAQLTGALRAMCDGDPRLTALATVPLQDPVAAAVAAAGATGVVIGTRAGGRELDDPAFTPFWEAADAAGTVVFLHPGYGSLRRRYADFGLMNGLGRIEDGTVTLARLLYAGIPARFPGLKLVVANGGGAVPYVLGRLVRNHLLDPARTRDPLESFALVYFDSVLSDSVALEFLVAKAGADHVLLGSDYPFRIGDPAPRETVGRARLTLGERELILGRTAASLFG